MSNGSFKQFGLQEQRHSHSTHITGFKASDSYDMWLWTRSDSQFATQSRTRPGNPFAFCK